MNEDNIDWEVYQETYEWDWTIDQGVAWAKVNNIDVYYHTLIYNANDVLPKWLYLSELGELNQSERKALLWLMENHIKTIMTHFCDPETQYDGIPLDGAIYAYDVLNEVLKGDGTVHQNLI